LLLAFSRVRGPMVVEVRVPVRVGAGPGCRVRKRFSRRLVAEAGAREIG